MEDSQDFKVIAGQLADIARWAYRKGWAPATSTNYSVRLPEHAAPAFCAITSSGMDKETIDPEQVLAVDRIGVPVNGCALEPSAETPLSCHALSCDGGRRGVAHTLAGRRIAFPFGRRRQLPNTLRMGITQRLGQH